MAVNDSLKDEVSTRIKPNISTENGLLNDFLIAIKPKLVQIETQTELLKTLISKQLSIEQLPPAPKKSKPCIKYSSASQKSAQITENIVSTDSNKNFKQDVNETFMSALTKISDNKEN